MVARHVQCQYHRLMSSDATLRFEELAFAYRRQQPVLDGFSLTMEPGRWVMLGPNGAGKTTLLSLAADVLRPARGSVAVGSLRAADDRTAYRRAVAWMPQTTRAVPGLSCREQVAYAGWLKGQTRQEAWNAALPALAMVGLGEAANRRTGELSGGQLRRVGLAQTLVHDAQVILLDEPSSGLDPAQRARFRSVLTDIPCHRTVVVSTHQVDDLADVFDGVAVVADGQLRFQGSVGEFMGLAEASSDRPAEAAYASLVGAD